MPRIRRWHPVSHDFTRDPEVQELRRRFGDWTGFLWLEMLSIADRNEGYIKGDPAELAQWSRIVWVEPAQDVSAEMSKSARRLSKWSPVRARKVLDWMMEKGWIVLAPCPNGARFFVRNYPEYHRTRALIKSRKGIIHALSEPSEPTRPSEPTKNQKKKRTKDSPPSPAAPLEKSPGSAVWDAYREAYNARYGTEPVRNAKVNTLLARFSKRVPEAEAPEVARFYVGHNGQLYVRSGHAVELLLRDAEKLRTEWATGRMVTETEAREVDRRQGVGDRYRRVAERYEREAQHEDGG